jgi:Glycosyltransferases involved in cell wall biogenesis
MPKVSVIITVYNIAQYLSEAIDSVLKQSFKDFEIIIVDDGSIDDTREVVNKYLERDLRINYIYQENKGPGAARNTGIKAAKGQYVAFLDGDDVLTQESLAERIALLERFSEVSFVYSDSIVQNNEQSKNVKGILEKKKFSSSGFHCDSKERICLLCF